MVDNYYLEDFTESNYRKIIKIAKLRYEFISFADLYKKEGKNLLMRHDVDFSVHRAYNLALIEKEENVHSTFFLWMHSPYYNLFESNIFLLLHEIIKLGHDIGIHFDPSFYEIESKGYDNIEDYLKLEKNILENLLKIKIFSFSLHNPNEHILKLYQDDMYVDMLNVYSKKIREYYKYCSDSNGYWRYERLVDILVEGSFDKLHVLLHPEWWTPTVLSPRERIIRAIDGRAKENINMYDALLKENNRLNIS